MTDNSAELILLRQLQKFFQNVKTFHSETKMAEDSVHSQIKTLQNQSEQYRICKSVDLSLTGLSEFPNLRPSILNKIRLNAEECIDALLHTM